MHKMKILLRKYIFAVKRSYKLRSEKEKPGEESKCDREPIQVNRSPKVVLDKDFVSKYLREKNECNIDNLTQDLSAISINESLSDDSVEFVGEEPANREMKKISQLTQQNANQKKRIEKLNIHVRALQNVIQNAGIPTQNPTATTNMEKNAIEPNSNVNQSNVVSIDDEQAATANAEQNASANANASANQSSDDPIDGSLLGCVNISNPGINETPTDEWLRNQIQLWEDNGTMPEMLNEFQIYMNNQFNA